jgi:hypothetical protein
MAKLLEITPISHIYIWKGNYLGMNMQMRNDVPRSDPMTLHPPTTTLHPQTYAETIDEEPKQCFCVSVFAI